MTHNPVIIIRNPANGRSTAYTRAELRREAYAERARAGVPKATVSGYWLEYVQGAQSPRLVVELLLANGLRIRSGVAL